MDHHHITRKHANSLFIIILFISRTTIVSGLNEYKPEDNQKLIEYHGIEASIMQMFEPFQVCYVCRCCAKVKDPTSCTSMPCCYVIDCLLPKKPFGVCAFVPKTCTCDSCPPAV